MHVGNNIRPQDKDPTFDNSNFGFTRPNGQKISFKPGEWQRLVDNIKAYYGAGDIFNREPIAKEKLGLGGLAAQHQGLKVGDLVSWKHPKKPKEQQEFHTQTVTEINKPWYWYDSFTTIQGNLNDSEDLPARETSYDFEDILTRVKEKGENIKVKEWNFNEFDKKGKP